MVQAGGRAGEEASLPSLTSRRPPSPHRCPARGESKLCARRPLVPRSCHCGSARAPSPPGPPRVIAKTPGTAARLHLQSPVSWVPLDPRTQTWGGVALRVFYFFSKTVPKTGRSALAPRAAPAVACSRGPCRALSGPRCPPGSDAATSSPRPAAPWRLPSAALATIYVWGSTPRRKGGFSLSGTLLGTTCNVQPQEDARGSVECRRCGLENPEFDQT